MRSGHCGFWRTWKTGMPMAQILLIDDDADLVELFADMLSHDGFEVQTAQTFQAAIELIRNGYVPDAMVVDFWIGNEDPTAFLDAVRADYPEIPFLVISGGRDALSLEMTQAVADISGAIVFLQKPFRRAELTGALTNVLAADKTA